MVRVKFDLDIDYNASNDVHFSSTINDYTLCGLTMDGDMKTAGSFDVTKEKVNCKQCIEIVESCKKVRRNHYEKK